MKVIENQADRQFDVIHELLEGDNGDSISNIYTRAYMCIYKTTVTTVTTVTHSPSHPLTTLLLTH
ncbi:MAG: hypothetical protein KBS69_05510 [Bacteroidales bacterium]|nr:hypothetical protein [Candidatus Colicola caccequi]